MVKLKTMLGLLLISVAYSFNGYSERPITPILKYDLKISNENLRLVEIKASLVTDGPYLEMNPWGIPPEIERGWAKFVEIKSIEDDQGRAVEFEWDKAEKKWKLDIDRNSKINLQYAVRLAHDEHNWDAAGGVDGRPTVWSDGTIFWSAGALFIYSGEEISKTAEINFDVPKNWKVSTSWIKTGALRFKANNVDELVHNLLMIGHHEERIVKHDNMSITIATPASFSHKIDLIEETLAQVLPSYKMIFDELPKVNYLICASKNSIQDGEAYMNSFHQMFLDKDMEYNKMVWANTLAHEMFHYWNGTKFIYSNDYAGNYWFSEGFTNYYSSLTLLRTGIIDEEDYQRFLAFQFSKANAFQTKSKEKLSLVEAGKSKMNNWDFIYGGGTSVAFILDVEIRAITSGDKNLDDLMQVLYAKYGKVGKPISLEIQVDELNRLTNSDFKPFFDSYIIGKSPLLEVILEACDKAGLAISHFQNDFFLTARKDDQNTLYQSIIKPLEAD